MRLTEERKKKFLFDIDVVSTSFNVLAFGFIVVSIAYFILETINNSKSYTNAFIFLIISSICGIIANSIKLILYSYEKKKKEKQE